MATKDLFLGIDVGTQGTKGLVLDIRARRVIARAQVSYGLIEGLAPGAAEQHPETWVQAVRDVVRRLLADPGVAQARLGGIAISGQQHGAVVLDGDDEIVRPAKLWCDTETAPEAAELSQAFGSHLPAGFTASKLLWIARHEPKAWARVRAVLLPHDYVNFRLTGRKCMEAGDASGTGFFDPRLRGFSDSAMRTIDRNLPAMIPPLLPAGSVVGEVTAEAAVYFGLPEGLAVATGGGDNMLSAIGSGAALPGTVVVSLGTSGTVFAGSPVPIIDPEGLIAPFCDSTGGWLPLLCVMNATGVTEEVRRIFGGLDHAELTRRAAAAAAGCDGLLFLPFLQGERVPDLPRATGSILGIRPGLLDPGHLYRAAMEGVSLNLASGVERLRSLGLDIRAVRLVGGGAKNPVWRQILADVLGVEIRMPAETESGALGAAIQAYWTLARLEHPALSAGDAAAPFIALEPEIIEPDGARSAVYRDLGVRFRSEVRRLHP